LDLTKEQYRFFKHREFLKSLVFLWIMPNILYALLIIILWFILKDRSDSKQICATVYHSDDGYTIPARERMLLLINII